MDRTTAKQIAKTITNEQLQQMFDNAKKSIKDWTATSSCNKHMSKEAAWYILTKSFDIDTEIPFLHKINMLQEFGDFLPIEKTLFELYLDNKADTYLTHFTAPLVQAYKNADLQNRKALDKAFPEYFIEKGNFPND